ncbi:MAG: NADH-quinone oxidoreductase subunit J [Longimicrobiales bacterium]|jgi:NADH-quinone oxidoreductase subunit J|uniref:NADH-quinone oxidoreductase subunit J n=1 Tax=marine metagenome TaxID=408172 RepID=A0A381NFR4_9ZZZZ|nr:NADH-quinone oxidoreductase subunit J [Gemmatimonadota bacterium]MDE0730177.1 NADH-quinone oxidoreductase subunit J [Longimicrobiales bacterium]MEC7807489.1 NADH-quinone oxidoreductase subunit J [Gemmatimonadota bacterium]MEC9316919.1 NADH-quinone oxidoreductase subunit J [Gemmatimonadota bacterium]|tara:strand:- start:11918 stop:12436 length:519 start_codon:yes stop_codon:yes gene_type:complete
MIEVLFYVFAAVALGGALGVVWAKSPVGSLLYMVATLASLACIFVLLEAHFLAAIQVIVYAGAIMVLFLFVIMLLNLGHDYQRDLKGGAFSLLSFVIIGLMAGVLVRQFGENAITEPTAGGRAIDAALAQHGAVGAIAQPLYTTYVVPFEITGVLLLVAIVGALVLAKKGGR